MLSTFLNIICLIYIIVALFYLFYLLLSMRKDDKEFREIMNKLNEELMRELDAADSPGPNLSRKEVGLPLTENDKEKEE